MSPSTLYNTLATVLLGLDIGWRTDMRRVGIKPPTKQVQQMEPQNTFSPIIQNSLTADAVMFGYGDINYLNEHSSEAWQSPPGTPCI